MSLKSQETARKTIDFGAPSNTGTIQTFGAHLFRVEIPDLRNQKVVIVEDFGYLGLQDGISQEEERVSLSRTVWAAIAETARREFNDRLKSAKMPTSRWRTGKNLVDRLLGKEICVLAWAAETADEHLIPIICNKWAALRPEERWWLFSMTVAEAGLPEDTERGWRKALFYALSDGDKPTVTKKKHPRPSEIDAENSLFSPTFYKDTES